LSQVLCATCSRDTSPRRFSARAASWKLASGDLTTRASSTIASRQDEIGDLQRDFDAMATRFEALVSGQRQPISDVSHELRSPLTRLNVALDRGRQRKGNDAAFDQMEQDLALLNEMIGRLLTIAKLDVSARHVPMVQVDLTELISQIVRDANFEARALDRGVQFNAKGVYLIHGNTELLRGAIENVVRNAIHYTPPGTSVEVLLEPVRQPKQSFVRVSIRDYGPGLPKTELIKIFRPFYRVADARDRQSGGTGLGLAIADRVIQTHGGTIRAKNAPPTGLLVEILLSAAGSDSA
jgi:two-component system, OmpR family, sensor histidine kinase CpxA